MEKKNETAFKMRLVVSVVLLVVIPIMIVGCGGKDHRDYVQIFEENKGDFDSAKVIFAQIDGEYIVEVTQTDAVLRKDGETCTLDNLFNTEKADDIMKFMSELEIKAINKREDQIEFVFVDQPDTHGIFFVLDTQWMNSYTSVQDLGDGWYYFYFLHE